MEARVLFEISKTECCTANQLCSILDIDRSYMSRIIRKFEEKGFLVRRTSNTDNRNMEIQLTKTGSELFHELNNRSNDQIVKTTGLAQHHKLKGSMRDSIYK